MNCEVGVIMGSDSDLPVMKEACEILEEFEISYEVEIVSAHRTPDKMYQYAGEASQRGLKVIIAGAGGSAHLPGMVASMTDLPVIGVPIKSRSLSGVDSLYSIVQMPGGIPVATVAINGAKNAGLLAVRILGAGNDNIKKAHNKFRNKKRKEVIEKGERLRQAGYASYLQRKEEEND